MKRILLLITLVGTVATMMAQVGVEARIDSIQMLIGQQVHVTVTVTAPADAKVIFPTYKSRELLVEGGIATFVMGILTGGLFGDAPKWIVHLINPESTWEGFPALIDPLNDTVKVLVGAMILGFIHLVAGMVVQDNPFLWSDWSLVFWLSVLMLLLLGVASYLYIRLRDNKPLIKSFKLVKRLLPHQKAMKEIEQIKADKMVSSENQKEYYTKLTDTLRRYIEERYKFSAMEMTSSEIIERLTRDGDQKSLDELRQLFTTADLVKFAKYSTLINENDMNLVNAIEFINQTKQEQQVVEEEKPQLSAEDQRSLKTRRALKGSIAAAIIVSLVLLGFVIYRLMILTGVM